MPNPAYQVLEQQVELYVKVAAVTNDQAASARRRADLLHQLAGAKRAEAEMRQGQADGPRLSREAALCDREASICLKEADTLRAEADRALAQAATARQKSAAVSLD